MVAIKFWAKFDQNTNYCPPPLQKKVMLFSECWWSEVCCARTICYKEFHCNVTHAASVNLKPSSQVRGDYTLGGIRFYCVKSINYRHVRSGSGDKSCRVDHRVSGCEKFGRVCLFRWVSKISLARYSVATVGDAASRRGWCGPIADGFMHL